MRGSGHFTLYCLLSAGLFLVVSDASGATATASEAWVDEFFAAYNLEDGKHLTYYSEDIVLVDETAGQTVTGMEQMHAVFEGAKQSYSDMAWVIEEEIFSENRVVVRGRSTGKAFGQPYDIAFTTWFEIEDGKIVRQIDYADYAALLRQIQVSE